MIRRQDVKWYSLPTKEDFDGKKKVGCLALVETRFGDETWTPGFWLSHDSGTAFVSGIDSDDIAVIIAWIPAEAYAFAHHLPVELDAILREYGYDPEGCRNCYVNTRACGSDMCVPCRDFYDEELRRSHA